MDHRHRSFSNKDEGFRETKLFFKGPFGKPCEDLFYELDDQLNPCDQDDGSFPSLEASFWKLTDNMDVPTTVRISVTKASTCCRSV